MRLIKDGEKGGGGTEVGGEGDYRANRYTVTTRMIPALRWAWFSVALRPQRRVGLLGTGTEWEGGERVKGSTAETARKRPERPWTAARTMEVLRRCPLAIAQRLVHCAVALSTAVLDRVTKTMSVAPLLTNNLDNSKQKMSNLLSPRHHLPTHDLFWAKVRVQLHLPPLRYLDLLISPGTLWKIKMGSDECHFNVSVGSEGQSHKTVSTNHSLS